MTTSRRATTTPRRQRERTTRAAPANSSRDVALSQDQIVAAAIDWIDREGIQAFSMRRLAASLDISGPALYWHFGSRGELLEAAAERVLQQVDSAKPRSRERWDRAARRILTSVWEVAKEHPGLLDILRTQPLHTDSGERLLQSMLVVLRRAGFPPAAAVAHGRSLLWTTFGFIRSTAATLERVHEEPPTRVVSLQLDTVADADSLELIAGCLPHLTALDIDALFQHTLNLLLAGVAAAAAAQHRR